MRAELTTQGLQIRCRTLQAAGVTLAENLQFMLHPGELNVLRGANGVGKSTLLRGMANSLPGQAVLFKPEYGLRDELLVSEQLEFVLEHAGQKELQLDDLLKKVGLADWQHERVGTLSSGQRARLGLCALLAGQFKVWLLDEPLNALDVDGQALLADAVTTHFQAGGIVFMATHVDPAVVLAHMPGICLKAGVLEKGKLTGNLSEYVSNHKAPSAVLLKPMVPLSALLKRELAVLLGNPQALLWGALFHWMILSFFGIGLGNPGVEFSRVAVWVSLLLATLLGAKDWFLEDHRVGWVRWLSHLNPDNLGTYWLVRVLTLTLSQIAVLVPVTGLVALQFGLSGSQSLQLIVALAAGLWAITPLLALIALLVMLTRGGAVLVYLLALPLLVPVLIFGLEASQANDLGRSALPPLAVLASLGLLLCLLGPLVGKRLVALIQE